MRTISADEGTLWGGNFAPLAWTGDDRIHGNARNAVTGLWEGWSVGPDGDSMKLWAPQAFGNGRHWGVGDVTPDGRFAVLVAERLGHKGTMNAGTTEPGAGLYNDLWLSDGSNVWPLTSPKASGLLNSGNAIIWPRFNEDGTKLVWSRQYLGWSLGEDFGCWNLRVTDVSWWQGQPSLVNIKRVEPQAGKFYEPYQIYGDRMLFASDMKMGGYYNSAIWTSKLDGSDVKQISFDVAHFMMNAYCEFGKVLSDGSIIYSRVYQSQTNGMDKWVARPDGSSYRLTYWSDDHKPNNISGGFCVSPDETKLLTAYGTLSGPKSIQAVMFDLESQ